MIYHLMFMTFGTCKYHAISNDLFPGHTYAHARLEWKSRSNLRGKSMTPKPDANASILESMLVAGPSLDVKRERESIHMKGWHSVHRIPSPIDPNSLAWHWVQNPHKKSSSKQDQEAGEVGGFRCVQPLFNHCFPDFWRKKTRV